MLTRLHELAGQRRSFAFETTLASRTYATWLRTLHDDGYNVTLLFLWLSSPEVAIARVAERVRAGGHDVPTATIQRRFHRGLRNFLGLYRPLVTKWQVYDGNAKSGPRLIAGGGLQQAATIHDERGWQRVLESAHA